MTVPDRRSVAEVDVGAVERNCARLARELEVGARLCAVVKADGYGHGSVECARAAIAGGATWLAVAAADEAAELRAHFADAQLLTMGALTDSELDLALDARSEIAIWRPEHVNRAAARGVERGVRPRVHVKYDTGMGRLGERDAEAVLDVLQAAARDERLELAGFWTHFATADERASDFFDRQLERFSVLVERVRADHPEVLVHAANSAATLRDRAAHFDMVRCGVAIYGLDPFGDDPYEQELEPALELRSYVADVKRFEVGDSAGYGRRWRAPVETFVGVLPIGYGDGVRRGLTNNADVLVDGHRVPLVGTVSMDNVTIELGPATRVSPGARATLIGAQGDSRILCEEVARRLDTINYEVTCGISPRVPRVYVDRRPNGAERP
ncbi:MAG: alanine racemase [Solirubrobacterales bacterium]